MKNVKTAMFFFCFCFLFYAPAYAEQGESSRLIAVAAEGSLPGSEIARAGRCAYFILYDDTATVVETVANPFADARRQAGVSAVGFLHDRGVGVIVAESFGNRMEAAMDNVSMNYFQYRGRVDEGIHAFLQNR